MATDRGLNEKAQREIDAYIEAWQKMKAQGVNIGLWENPDLVSDFMAAMGRKGGKARNPKKGFGSMTPEGRSAAAKKGLQRRWAKTKVKTREKE